MIKQQTVGEKNTLLSGKMTLYAQNILKNSNVKVYFFGENNDNIYPGAQNTAFKVVILTYSEVGLIFNAGNCNMWEF